METFAPPDPSTRLVREVRYPRARRAGRAAWFVIGVPLIAWRAAVFIIDAAHAVGY